MSDPHLPEELLDNVVDLLYDERDALKSCCLVSKSWIPRTRKHLFAEVEFPRAENLESWKTAFPDPSTSPACYAKSLFFQYPDVITDADGEEGGLIRAFSRVVRVDMNVSGNPTFLGDLLSTEPLFTPEPTCLIKFHGSRPPSNHSIWSLPPFHPHSYSTSSIRSLFSRISPWTVATKHLNSARIRSDWLQTSLHPHSPDPWVFISTGGPVLSHNCCCGHQTVSVSGSYP